MNTSIKTWTTTYNLVSNKVGPSNLSSVTFFIFCLQLSLTQQYMARGTWKFFYPILLTFWSKHLSKFLFYFRLWTTEWSQPNTNSYLIWIVQCSLTHFSVSIWAGRSSSFKPIPSSSDLDDMQNWSEHTQHAHISLIELCFNGSHRYVSTIMSGITIQ